MVDLLVKDKVITQLKPNLVPTWNKERIIFDNESYSSSDIKNLPMLLNGDFKSITKKQQKLRNLLDDFLMNPDLKKKYQKSTYTLTFGEVAENNVGMEQIGSKIEKGFTKKELLNAKEYFDNLNFKTEFIKLNDLVDEDQYETEFESAYLLIIRNGLSNFCDLEDLYREVKEIKTDKKLYNARQKKVQNKHARFNICFADYSQKADFEEGKGTVVNFTDVPKISKIRDELPNIFGKKAKKLFCEENYYYNKEEYDEKSEIGIGWHGDTERRIVIGCRLGQTKNISFNWFYQNKSIGEKGTYLLNHGDMYIMSDKTVGSDWKKRKIPTLRHAAGFIKYSYLEKKIEKEESSSLSSSELEESEGTDSSE